MTPETICIVGGRGRMGSLMGRFFEEAGNRVAIVDQADGPILWNLVAEHEVILLAVPIPAMEGVLEQLGPLTRVDGAVIDIASVKDAPVEAMLRSCRGEVIGCHPLFGPATDSLRNEIVFVCPTRSTRWIGWFRSFLDNAAAEVIDIDPKEHDELMATVQVLRHLLLLCLGRSLMRLEFDLAENLPRSGRWFSGLVAMLRRQLDQDPQLYADLAFHNPASAEVVERFLESAEEICSYYGSHDRVHLVRTIGEVSRYVKEGLHSPSDKPISDPIRSCISTASNLTSSSQHPS